MDFHTPPTPHPQTKKKKIQSVLNLLRLKLPRGPLFMLHHLSEVLRNSKIFKGEGRDIQS